MKVVLPQVTVTSTFTLDPRASTVTHSRSHRPRGSRHISICGLVSFIKQSCRTKRSDSGEAGLGLGQAQVSALLLVSGTRFSEIIRVRWRAPDGEDEEMGLDGTDSTEC